MFGFVAGFVSGTAFGAYLAQNYQLPDVKDWVTNFREAAKKYEKDKKKDNGSDS